MQPEPSPSTRAMWRQYGKLLTTLGCCMEVDSADSRSTSARLDSAQLCATIFTATRPPHQRPAPATLVSFAYVPLAAFSISMAEPVIVTSEAPRHIQQVMHALH